METKLAKLKAAAARNDWRSALRIATRFAELGEHKAAILRAHQAHENGRFYAQLGHDPGGLFAAGVAALCARYGLTPPPQEPKPMKTPSKRQAKPAKAPRARKAPATKAPATARLPKPPAPARRIPARFVAIEEAARNGVMPAPPDFSKPSHHRYHKKLAALVALVEARDVAGLRKFEETHNVYPVSDSRKAMLRYRDWALLAIEAGA